MTATKLWLLGKTEANESANKLDYADDSPFYIPYDCCHGFVIEAHDENEARAIADKKHGDEGEGTWLNPKWTFCIELIANGKVGVILCDFYAA